MIRIFLFILKFYKIVISPFLPASCRFTPTCSEYAYQAIKRYGILRGCWLSTCRLMRCHPFHACGYDPVK